MDLPLHNPCHLHFSHTSPILSLLNCPSPFHSLHSLHFCHLSLLVPTNYCLCIVPQVFIWYLYVVWLWNIIFGISLFKKDMQSLAWWNVKCFFVLDLLMPTCAFCFCEHELLPNMCNWWCSAWIQLRSCREMYGQYSTILVQTFGPWENCLVFSKTTL